MSLIHGDNVRQDITRCREEVRSELKCFAENIHKQVGLIGDVEREARPMRLKSVEEPPSKAKPGKPTCAPPQLKSQSSSECVGFISKFFGF